MLLLCLLSFTNVCSCSVHQSHSAAPLTAAIFAFVNAGGDGIDLGDMGIDLGDIFGGAFGGGGFEGFDMGGGMGGGRGGGR